MKGFWSSFAAISLTLSTVSASAEALVYDEIFPLYLEQCSYTQFERTGYGIGHPGGHATLYLKGACMDESGPIPLIKLCDELAAARSLEDIPAQLKSDPEWGVNISVDDNFGNVNWVAVPGKSLALQGLPTMVNGKAVVDESAIQRVADELTRLRVFRGVRLIEHRIPKFSQRPGFSLDRQEWFLAENGVGTDAGITYARRASCAKVPVSRYQLELMVKMLNGKQMRAYEKGNKWDGVTNNCTHTIQQALSAAGIRGNLWNLAKLNIKGKARKIINQLVTVPFAFFGQIAVPSNEFITLARMSNLGLKDLDPVRIYNDRRRVKEAESSHIRRAAVQDPIWSWLPKQPGAMVEVFEPLEQAESSPFVLHTNVGLILATPPLNELLWFLPKNGKVQSRLLDLDFKHRKAQKYEIEDPDSIYRNVENHVAYHRDLLEQAKAKYAQKNPRPKDPEFTAFWNAYVQALETRSDQLNMALKIQ